jgi:hypothetical protein
MHDSFLCYFAEYVYPDIRTWMQARLPDFKTGIVLNTTKPLTFNSESKPPCNKEMDAGIRIWQPNQGHYGSFPVVVVETGYSETWNELMVDGSEWLWGSSHRVQSVILVKLQKPAFKKDFADETKWEGFLEIHVRRVDSRYVQIQFDSSPGQWIAYGSTVTFKPFPLATRCIFFLPNNILTNSSRFVSTNSYRMRIFPTNLAWTARSPSKFHSIRSSHTFGTR